MTDYTVDVGWAEDVATATSGDPNFADYFQGLKLTKSPTEPEDVVRLEDIQNVLFIGVPGSGTSLIDTPDMTGFGCGGGAGQLAFLHEDVDASDTHYGIDYSALYMHDDGTGGIAADARVQPFVNDADPVDCTGGYWVAVGGRYEAGDKLLAQKLGVRVPGASLESAALTIGAWRETGADNDRWIAFRRLNAYGAGAAGPPKYSWIYSEATPDDPFGMYLIEVLDETATPTYDTQERLVIADWRADGADHVGYAGGLAGFGLNTKPIVGDILRGYMEYEGVARCAMQNDSTGTGDTQVEFMALAADADYSIAMGVGGANSDIASWGYMLGGAHLLGMGVGFVAGGNASMVIYGDDHATEPALLVNFGLPYIELGSGNTSPSIPVSAGGTWPLGGFAHLGDELQFYHTTDTTWYNLVWTSGASGETPWVRDTNGITFNEASKNAGIGIASSTLDRLKIYNTVDVPSNIYSGVYVDAAPTFTQASSAYYAGFTCDISFNASASPTPYNWVAGMYLLERAKASTGGAQTIKGMYGAYLYTSTDTDCDDLTVTNSAGIYLGQYYRKVGGGTVALTNTYGVLLGNDSGATATIGTHYDFYSSVAPPASTVYGMYIGHTGLNYFGGRTSIGGAMLGAQYVLYTKQNYAGSLRVAVDNVNAAGGSEQAEFMAMVNSDANESIAIGVAGSNTALANWGYVLGGSGLTNGIGWGYAVGSGANFITYPSGLTKFNEAGVAINTSPATTYALSVNSDKSEAEEGDCGVYLTYGCTVKSGSPLSAIYGFYSHTQPVIEDALTTLYGNSLITTLNNNPAASKTVTTMIGNRVLTSLGGSADSNLTISNMMSLRVSMSQNIGSTATVTNKYVLYLDATTGFAGTPYGIFQAGGSDRNYLAGDTGIGVSPTGTHTLESPSIQATSNFYSSDGSAGTNYSGPIGALITITIKDGLVTAYT